PSPGGVAFDQTPGALPWATMADNTTEWAAVGDTQLFLLRGGQGQPCLVLHGIEGHEGWRALHDGLAEHSTVLAPSHPGYGQTEAPSWIPSIWHQALFYSWYLQANALHQVNVIGLGLGGWIAAYLALVEPQRLAHLILVDAFG